MVVYVVQVKIGGGFTAGVEYSSYLEAQAEARKAYEEDGETVRIVRRTEEVLEELNAEYNET